LKHLGNLTDKQKLFCDMYISCLNKTKSAKEAGYLNPNGDGSRVYKKPHVQNYIKERLEEQKEIRTAGQKEILNFLSRVLRGEIKEKHTLIIKGETLEIEKDCKVSDKLKVCDMFCKIYSMYGSAEINTPTIIYNYDIPRVNLTHKAKNNTNDDM